jgi:catalase
MPVVSYNLQLTGQTMPDLTPAPALPQALNGSELMLRLGIIGVVMAGSVAAFAYTGGWFSPDRLSAQRMVASFEAANGAHPGFRRNHAKGVCATGFFTSDGSAVSLSKAAIFAPGRVPVVGRIAYAGGMPAIADSADLVRSLALQFLPPSGEEWRTGMINIPVFPVSTPQAFYDQAIAVLPDPSTGKPDPSKMKTFVAAHPEFLTAVALITERQISSGFDNTTYNSINTFRFVNAAGAVTPVRWSAVPLQPFSAPSKGAKPADANGMFDALIAEVARHPVQWRLMITAGQPTDPVAPSLAWPADRPQVEAGIVTIDRLSSEDGGPCKDVNYDPLVLPSGIEPSDDPILSARSAAYSRSFTLRENEHGLKPPSAVTPQDVVTGGKP